MTKLGKRPRIGITCGVAGVPVAEGILASHYVGLGYALAVDQAGGLPLILPAVSGHEEADAGEVLDMLDGVLLAGGTDIDPLRYDQEPMAGTAQKPDPSRDAFELALVREARARKVPILGICRGLQLLNIAYGGTLNQHRPHQADNLATIPGLRAKITTVGIEDHTRMRAVFDRDQLQVVCLHHQAIEHVGSDLRVVARAEDGLIEGLEDPSSTFVLGVLWHPEQMLDKRDGPAVYRALVEAAKER
jgi:putative glutamine amidotransferase